MRLLSCALRSSKRLPWYSSADKSNKCLPSIENWLSRKLVDVVTRWTPSMTSSVCSSSFWTVQTGFMARLSKMVSMSRVLSLSDHASYLRLNGGCKFTKVWFAAKARSLSLRKCMMLSDTCSCIVGECVARGVLYWAVFFFLSLWSKEKKRWLKLFLQRCSVWLLLQRQILIYDIVYVHFWAG